MVRKSLSPVLHMFKADSESLIKVDMSYSDISFGCKMVQYSPKRNTSSIILRIDTTINLLG